MTTATQTTRRSATAPIEFVTFYVGDLLMGVDIRQVQEINRELNLTEAPQAPPCIRGVVNLRGEVVTVMDLRVVLGLDPTEITSSHRSIVIDAGGERIGLLADRIGDVVTAKPNEIRPTPANVSGVEGRFMQGVFKLDSELLVVLDVEECLTTDTASTRSTRPAQPSQQRIRT